jgi:zinc transporter ZupT
MEDHSTPEQDAARLLKRQLLMSGVVTAVGIALHNFPEGIAVFLAAQKSPAVGECLSGYSSLVLGIYMDSACAATMCETMS